MKKARNVLLVLGLVLTACGGDGTGANGGSSELPDPCSLIQQTVLDSYFDEDVTPVPSGSDRFLSCTWSDSRANSVGVSVASSSEVSRPDPCTNCVDLAYGDDGYATAVPIQASATFVTGGRWYSVSTTGLGDDTDSIAALGELVYQQVNG